jgi:outer membrane protein OmpA-like peptidoglycan-associated protein
MHDGIRNGLLCAGLALLVGCGSASRGVAADGGGAREIIFPDPGSASFAGGIYPNVQNLRQVGPGLSKPQIYDLLGPPHFHEGVFSVREWNYLFNFHLDGGVMVCQYKVLFDRHKLARSFYWKPTSCADLLKPATPVQPVATGTPLPAEPLRLSADSLFAFDSDTLTEAGRSGVDGILRQVRSASEVQRIQVVGYTDRIGSESYNKALSERRAAAVRDYLVAAGVAGDRIQAEGRGESEPRVECADRRRDALIACLAPNRRVEISGVASNQP